MLRRHDLSYKWNEICKDSVSEKIGTRVRKLRRSRRSLDREVGRNLDSPTF